MFLHRGRKDSLFLSSSAAEPNPSVGEGAALPVWVAEGGQGCLGQASVCSASYFPPQLPLGVQFTANRRASLPDR